MPEFSNILLILNKKSHTLKDIFCSDIYHSHFNHEPKISNPKNIGYLKESELTEYNSYFVLYAILINLDNLNGGFKIFSMQKEMFAVY